MRETLSRIYHGFAILSRTKFERCGGAPALLVERRAAFALRSAASLLFAVGFLWPALSQPMFVRLFAGYLFVDGVLALASSGASRSAWRVWPLLAGGAFGVIATAAAYGWPHLVLPLLVDIAALWALAVSATFALAYAALRAADPHCLLLVNAIASAVLARALRSPAAADLVVLSSWFGLYALSVGIVWFKLALRQYRLPLR